MSAQAMYKEIEKYINETASDFLAPIGNIESIRCARRVDDIYVELVHEDSTVRYFDISSLDLSKIGLLIGHILANDPISIEIKDRNRKKEVRRLFK